MKPSRPVRWALVLGGVALALCGRAHAADENAAAPRVDLRQVLTHRAMLRPSGDRDQRLSIPAEVLAQCRADLADLRLLDERGRSVPFALEPPTAAAPPVVTTMPVLVDVDRARDGEGRPRTERWVFEIGTVAKELEAIDIPLVGHQSFVGRVSVDSIGADGTTTRIARATPLFRIPSRAGRTVERSRIPVMRIPTSRVVVQVEVEEGNFVAPGEVSIRERRGADPALERIPLRVESIHASTSSSALGEEENAIVAGRSATRVQLDLPAGIAPRRLIVRSATPWFVRRARVLDPQGVELANGVLARLPSREGEAADDALELDVVAPRPGPWVVEIEDGDEAPLERISVEASVALPTLVFRPLAEGEVALYWGGGRLAHVPDRSLASWAGALSDPTTEPTATELVPRSMAGAAAELREWVTRLPEASLGKAEPNPMLREEPRLFLGVRRGSTLDSRGWPKSRRVTLAESPEGLGELVLDAEDLALLRPDLGDLRIVDAQHAQVPYVLGDAEPVQWALAVGTDAPRDRASHVPLALPAAPVGGSRLTLDFDGTFLDRTVRVMGEIEGAREPRLLGTAHVVRRGEEAAPLRLSLQRAGRIRSLSVDVPNGDDAPVTLRSATLEVPTYRVVFAAAPGIYEMLLGNGTATAPRYELEAARDVALALPTGTAKVEPLAAHSAYRAPSWLGREGSARAALWGSIALAVVVLVGLTFRLAGRESPPA